MPISLLTNVTYVAPRLALKLDKVASMLKRLYIYLIYGPKFFKVYVNLVTSSPFFVFFTYSLFTI